MFSDALSSGLLLAGILLSLPFWRARIDAIDKYVANNIEENPDFSIDMYDPWIALALGVAGVIGFGLGGYFALASLASGSIASAIQGMFLLAGALLAAATAVVLYTDRFEAYEVPFGLFAMGAGVFLIILRVIFT